MTKEPRVRRGAAGGALLRSGSAQDDGQPRTAAGDDRRGLGNLLALGQAQVREPGEQRLQGRGPLQPGQARAQAEVRTVGESQVRPLFTAQVEDVRVPASQVVGEVNRGWYHMMASLDMERIMVGFQGLGLCELTTQNAIRYAQDRKQGKATNGSASDSTYPPGRASMRRGTSSSSTDRTCSKES